MWTHNRGSGLDVRGQVSLMVKWVNQLLEQAIIIVIIMGTYWRSTTNALVTYLIALMINSKSRNRVCAEEMRAYAWPRHLRDLRPLLSDFLPHPLKVPLSLSSLTGPHCCFEPYLSFSPHRLWGSHHFRSYCDAIKVSVSSTSDL